MTPISRTLNVMAYQARSRRKRPTESEKTVINFANFDFPLDVLPYLDVLQFGHLIFSRRFDLVNVQDLLNLSLCSVPFPPLSPLHRCRDEGGQNKIEVFHLFSKKNPCGRFVVILLHTRINFSKHLQHSTFRTILQRKYRIYFGKRGLSLASFISEY